MIFVNAFIVLAALPVLNAGLVMLLIDRQLHLFLSPVRTAVRRSCGNTSSGPLATRSLHPWRLPAFGFSSEIIPVFSRKPIFSYELVAGSKRG